MSRQVWYSVGVWLASLLLQGAASAQPRPEPFSFGWPVPSRFVVEETVETAGSILQLQHLAEIKRVGAEELHLTLRGELLSLNGQDLRHSQPRQLLGQLGLVGQEVTLVITPQGRFLRVHDLNNLVEGTRQTALAAGAEPAQLEQLLADLHMMVKDRLSRLWSAWVEAWLELDPQDPARVVPCGRRVGERLIEGTRTLRLLAREKGVAQLQSESLVGGTEARDALEELLREVGQPAEVELYLRRTRVNATVNLRTLQPIKVQTEEETTLILVGKPPVVERERHTYTFRRSGS